jgi:hypothetical protein
MEIEREELQPGSEEAGISGAEQDEIDKEKQSTTEERTEGSTEA